MRIQGLFFGRFHESKDHITYVAMMAKLRNFMYFWDFWEVTAFRDFFFGFPTLMLIFRSAHICVIVIAALPNFMYIGESYTIRLLHPLMVLFCFYKRESLIFVLSHLKITEFHTFLRFLHYAVTYPVIFVWFSKKRSSYTCIIVILALSNFMKIPKLWDCCIQ